MVRIELAETPVGLAQYGEIAASSAKTLLYSCEFLAMLALGSTGVDGYTRAALRNPFNLNEPPDNAVCAGAGLLP